MRPLLREGPRGKKGGRAREAALDRDALVWALSALTQATRSPVDEKLLTGQIPPPYGVSSVVLGAEMLGLRAAWAKRPASSHRTLAAPFLVLLSPSLREPHYGLGAEPESLASLDSAAPNQRLAFLLCVEGDRVALFEQGQSSHTILPFSEFDARYAGQVLLAAPKKKPPTDPDAPALQARNSASAGSFPNCSSIAGSFAMYYLRRSPSS